MLGGKRGAAGGKRDQKGMLASLPLIGAPSPHSLIVLLTQGLLAAIFVSTRWRWAMADSNDGLTLEGLAQILRDHMDGTAARFAEVGARLDAVGARIDNLRGEVGIVATIVRDLADVVARHHDDIARHDRELEEHRRQIGQIFSRMEQHDARFEAMTRDIRRILDAMERRGGDGGGGRQV